MVAAFEGLTVLEGTANNIKEAWRRWGRAGVCSAPAVCCCLVKCPLRAVSVLRRVSAHAGGMEEVGGGPAAPHRAASECYSWEVPSW